MPPESPRPDQWLPKKQGTPTTPFDDDAPYLIGEGYWDYWEAIGYWENHTEYWQGQAACQHGFGKFQARVEQDIKVKTQYFTPVGVGHMKRKMATNHSL